MEIILAKFYFSKNYKKTNWLRPNSLSLADRWKQDPLVFLLVGGRLDGLLFGDVDSVEELSDVLVLDEYALLDLGGRLRNQFQVIALDGDLVLLSRLHAFDAIGHGHAPDVLFPEEVTYLHRLTAVLDGYVDGEMGVYALHLVTVAIGHTLDHIFNMTNHGSHGRDIFSVAEPLFHHGSLLANHLYVQLGVLE